MASPIPGSVLPRLFEPQVPLTPPHDCSSIPSLPSAFPPPLNALKPKPFGVMEAKVEAEKPSAPTTTATTQATASANMPMGGPEVTCASHDLHANLANVDATTPLDPRYLTMLSRVAAYYQQRSQAVANYQHQRCKAWANLQRQKCQEMTQAAMLVVAWYVRDRIQRRRKRQKRQFRRGLSERSTGAVVGGGGKVKKVDSVRKWMLQIPEGALSAHLATALEKPTDTDELEFSMDLDPPPDKDANLCAIADNLIKAQLARIDVPLLGTISFDEDVDSETDSDDIEMQRWQRDDQSDLLHKKSHHDQDSQSGPEQKGQQAQDEEDEDDYDDDDYDDDDYSYEDEDDDEGIGSHSNGKLSEMVQKGSGAGKHSSSSVPT